MQVVLKVLAVTRQTKRLRPLFLQFVREMVRMRLWVRMRARVRMRMRVRMRVSSFA